MKYYNEKRDEILKSKKEYYKKNKEKIIENKKNGEKITCECGSIFRKCDKSQHLKTKKHLKSLDSINGRSTITTVSVIHVMEKIKNQIQSLNLLKI